jgi:NTP pyrophosphatase (non-canonical NTP hydrolase)
LIKIIGETVEKILKESDSNGNFTKIVKEIEDLLLQNVNIWKETNILNNMM